VQYDDNPDFSSPFTIEYVTRSDYDVESPLDDGIWSWRVKAVDAAGNQSEWSLTDTFTVDTTSYCTFNPDKPALLLPENGTVDVSMTATLTASPFVDPDSCSTHWKSRWRVSEQEDFQSLTTNINMIGKDLTSWQISKLVLEPQTTYYWKVRYWGSNGNKSEWSEVFSFTTQQAANDADENGIPDEQEVDDYLDLDDDGIFDNNQTDEIKSIKTKKGNNHVGIRPQDSRISRTEALDPHVFSDDGDKPMHIPYGLVAFRLEVPNYGDTARVKIYFSEAASESSRWVRYDTVNGWQDYSNFAEFNQSRDEVTIELKDGGYGDNDHTENGIIVDPGGIGIYTSIAADIPSGVSPGDEAILQSGPVTLRASAFSDADGDIHYETHWLVRRADRVYSCLDYDPSFDHVASTGNLTEHTVSGLQPELKYVWKVGYKDFGSGDTTWSEEYTFKLGTSEADRGVSIEPGRDQADFKMVSFIQWPDDPAAESVFFDEMGGIYDPNYLKIGTYDPTVGVGSYVEYGNNLKIEPGRAYWFLARNGLDITVDGIPVSTGHDIDVALLYNSDSGNGWNMIAPPNNADYYWDSVEVLEYDANGNLIFGPTPIYALSETNPYIDKRLWRWEGGSYIPDTLWMMRYSGYWVKVKKANVFLRFPVGAQAARITNSKTMLALVFSKGKRWLKGWLPTPRPAIADADDSPPEPMGYGAGGAGALSERVAGDVGCFISTAVSGFSHGDSP
jgi:hypothetical protein